MRLKKQYMATALALSILNWSAYSEAADTSATEMQSTPVSQTKAKTYTDVFTGDPKSDTYAGIIDEYDGSFVFSDNDTIHIGAQGQAAIDNLSDKDRFDAIKIRDNNVLNLRVDSNGDQERFGIRKIVDKKLSGQLFPTVESLNINSPILNIDVQSDNRAEGVYIRNDATGLLGKATINLAGEFDLDHEISRAGVVNINVHGKKGANGLYAGGGNTQINVNGDLKIEANGEDTSNFQTVGILADKGTNDIKVYRNTTVKTNGTGILANDKATVELYQGANITVDKSANNINYAIASNGGTVNVNKKTNPEQHTSNISGNIGLLGDNSTINMNMSTATSTLNGVIVHKNNNNSNFNFNLAKGATWTNEVYGTVDDSFTGSVVDNFVGGDSEANTGYIKQNDTHDLTFNNYSGNTVVIYEHTGDGSQADNYTAGNTIVNHAKENSSLTMYTDSTGIDTTDVKKVDEVLNTLAGKLYYTGYINKQETNLNGKVQIASGLTSSSAFKRIENIVFDEKTGQGSYGRLDFSSQITGDKTVDIDYAKAGILQENGTYLFTKDATIALTDKSAINAQENVNIDATNKKLNVKVNGNTTETLSAINSTNKNTTITAGKLNINVNNTAGRAEGITVTGTDAANKAITEINAEVNIDTTGSKNAIGLHASGNSELTINGDVNFNVKDTTAPQGKYNYYSNGAIYAGGNQQLQQGSTINVNGNVNLQGNGIYANGNGSTVNINGGGIINVDENTPNGAFAIGAQSGTVNLNMDKNNSTALNNDLVINGNVGLSSGSVVNTENHKESVVNIGLATNKSELNGVIANDFVASDNEKGFTGSANLYLSNGATWNNELYGNLPTNWANGNFTGSKLDKLVGGDSEKTAGVIHQKDSHDININNYSGHTLVIYEHTGTGTKATDYSAGNIIIDKAAQNSGITLSTSKNNINMQDSQMVADVLNTLAGKLYYNAYKTGERNLNGKVQIASGLTSSSAALRVQNITFNEQTGQGSYVKPADSEIRTYDHQIIEDNYMGSSQQKYWQDKYISDGNRHYTFDTNAVISFGQGDKSNAHQHGFGVINWAGTGNGSIDMTGHKLSLVADGKNSVSQYMRANGIIVESETLDINNVKGLDITVKNSAYSSGIYVIGMPSQGAWDNGAGNAKLVINNDDNPENAVKIRFDNCTDIYAGISAHKNSGTATIDIKGLVDIDVANRGNAIQSFGGDISVGGGKLIAHDNNAIYSRGGNVLINSEIDSQQNIHATSDKRDVNIQGNIKADENGSVGVALNTNKSIFNGIVEKEANSTVNLLVANGALWTNESTLNMNENFTGSSIDHFVGGTNKNTAGYIYQKDKHALNIKNYSGNTVVMYEHTGDGTNSSDFAAGNVIIDSAAKNSGITLSTQSNGIEMTNNDKVAQVLNNLAGKLYYNAYKTGENNLTGKVQIAEGLTSSSASLKVGDIKFDKTTGQGSYQKETIVNMSAPITGNMGRDDIYVTQGILKENGKYNFADGANVTITTPDKSAIDLSQLNGTATNVDVNVKNGTLNLNSNSSTSNIKGIYNDVAQILNINVKDVNIKASTTAEFRKAEGILAGGSRNGTSVININGNVNINAEAKDYGMGEHAYGIHAEDDAQVTIDGNLTMKKDDGSWGVTNNQKAPEDEYGGFDTHTAGIFTEQGYNNKSGIVTVKGDTDMAVSGSGIKATGTGSQVNLEGNTNILIDKDAPGKYYAIEAIGGSTVNINMNEQRNAANTNTVDIKGNITVMPKPFATEENTTINLGLANKDSKLTGVLQNTFKDKTKGNINLYLQNNATWTNEAYGNLFGEFTGSYVSNFVGGSDASHAGVIIQKDTHNLTIDNYSGHSMVIYDHTGDGTKASDYAAGNTIIKHAQANSGITLSTSSTGITMYDQDMVNSVLNTLAGKLYYDAYKNNEKNLNGKVQIASGLTSSSAALKVGDITFNETTGQGSYVPPKAPEIPEHQTEVNFTTSITGDCDVDTEYLYAGVIKQDDTYQFEKDSSINIAKNNDPAINVKTDKVTVNAQGSTLNMTTTGKNNTFGINNTAKELELTADTTNIKVTSDGRVEGIHVLSANKDNLANTIINSNLNINANGVGYALGIYTAGNSELTVNGNITMRGENGAYGVDNKGLDGSTTHYYSVSGLYAGADYNVQEGATLNVNGNVDLYINGAGAFANGDGSTINLKGGSIEVNKDDVESYSLLAQSGFINMNMNDKLDGASNNKVNLKGNIGVLNGSINPKEKEKNTIINLGLSTIDSSLEGVIVNNFTKEQIAEGYTGKVNLYMSNGATWVNESYGAVSNEFTGSVVNKFVGGIDKAHAGTIFQKDSHDLTIKDYSGSSIIIYEHTGDGSNISDYKAGNTIIGQAQTGSEITMSTDNSGIDMQDKTKVEATLNALAGKLYYMNSANDTHLNGKVQIAGGLTSSSAALQVGDIQFKENHQGDYVEGTMTPGINTPNPQPQPDPDKPNPQPQPQPNPDKPNGDVEYGDYENNMMRGVRSAMTTSMLSWRDTAADMFFRTGQLRDGEQDGIWARTYGGKTEYDTNKIDIKNSYWAGQLGYDKALANGWSAGVAFDYQDGSADYLLGGTGDNSLYALGFYATKEYDDNSYLDLSAKVGKVKNDYKVYNEIGQRLDGDYSANAYSLSAQYGKRFEQNDGSYIEPQAELTWSRVNGQDYDAHSGKEVMNIHQEAFDSLVGRIGVKAGKETATSNIYAMLSLAHEFSGDIETTYFAKDGGLKSTTYDLGDTWSELTLGGSVNLSEYSTLYADVTTGLAGDFKHDWEANVGVKFLF